MKFAGLSLNGGRKEKFFLCLMQFYPQEKRWALEKVGPWEGYFPEVEKLAVDFPLTDAHCKNCTLKCPGELNCIDPMVQAVRSGIAEYLQVDSQLKELSPKNYEYQRVQRELVDVGGEDLWRANTKHLISRSFKRKLKKGYLPYWHRPIDFWIWSEYYDQLLEIFNYSYDSFGNSSLMLLNHFSYWKKNLPMGISLYESNNYITLIELLRAGIVGRRELRLLQGIETAAKGRFEIIKLLEKKLSLFIYDHDIECMVKGPRAFESFLLALSGTRLLENRVEILPDWANHLNSSFLIPKW